ncbi:MAG: S41 family peptidase [Candidatus Shapirobacteria bacterium]|jgi:carboxyl-terminal processing protease
MSLRVIRNTVILATLVILAAVIGYTFGQRSVTVQSGQLELGMMWRVKDKLAEVFLEREAMDDKTMTYGAIKGMVDSLGDPYTVFLTPDENKNQNEDLAGEFGGVGIQLGYKDGTLAIMAPLAKTPADRAGLRAGDLILKIMDKANNIDKDTAGISLNEAVLLIRGKIGTEVTLKIFRDDIKETFDVTLKRENIVVASIEMEWKEVAGKRVAWIKLNKFTERLYLEWPEIVNKILAVNSGSDYGGIVLDLRNNPGGYLQASVMVGSEFINEGMIVTQKASDGSEEEYPVDKSRRKLLEDKMVILVNGGSASASEILAGALQEYKRGKLVGEKTFGKGTVQQPENFRDGSGLHVTIAKWLLPSGKNIHKEGVTPDFEIKPEKTVVSEDKPKADTKDIQLDKAIEILLKE